MARMYAIKGPGGKLQFRSVDVQPQLAWNRFTGATGSAGIDISRDLMLNGWECTPLEVKEVKPGAAETWPPAKKGKRTKEAPKYSELFRDFWAAYPNRVGKGKAWESWLSIDGDASAKDIMYGIRTYHLSVDWLKDDGAYVPLPATWLNQRRWEDDPRAYREMQAP